MPSPIFNYSGREQSPEPVIKSEPEFVWDPEQFREAVKEATE